MTDFNKILDQAKEPVIIHWLGDMFDPKLKGYWGSVDIDQAMETCLSIMNAKFCQNRRYQNLPFVNGKRNADAAASSGKDKNVHRG